MNYKQLERDAKLGDYHAQQVLEERQKKLEKLPIRDILLHGALLPFLKNCYLILI